MGADKLYQEREFIGGLRRRNVIPHVAEYEPNASWPNWLTESERQDPGYAISQKKRIGGQVSYELLCYILPKHGKGTLCRRAAAALDKQRTPEFAIE
jgi:hypothetical protein